MCVTEHQNPLWMHTSSKQMRVSSALPTGGSSPLGPPLWHVHSCDLRQDHQASAFLIEIPGKIKHSPRKSVSAHYPLACRVGNAVEQLSCSRGDLHFIQCHCHSIDMETWYIFKPTMASDIQSIHFRLKITKTQFWLLRCSKCTQILLIPTLCITYNWVMSSTLKK